MGEDVLLQAIHAEIQARNAYELLAGRIETESGRLLMSAMAQEEEGHRATLANSYKKLTGTKYEFDPSIRVGPDLSFIKASVFRHTQALEALKLALGAEDEAIAFYTQAMQNPELKNDKGTFRSLIKFEKKHKKMLTKELERLEKTNHWNLPR